MSKYTQPPDYYHKSMSTKSSLTSEQKYKKTNALGSVFRT